MSAISINQPFAMFFDASGNPLENGNIYIGEASLSAETNPVAVYWDAAMTIPASQPIRTLAGYPVYNGAPAVVYVDGDYSITVKNKNGNLVFSSLNAKERISTALITGFIAIANGGTGASTAAGARANLSVPVQATRINVASVAGTVDLTANAPNCDDIYLTGNLTITGFTIAAGRVVRVTTGGTSTLTNNASIVTNRGDDIVATAGDTYTLRATAANVVEVMFYTRYGSSSAATQLFTFEATPSASTLIISGQAMSADFRSTTLSSGEVTTVRGTPANLVISNGSTLGTTSGQQSDIAILLINNAGTLEFAACNASGTQVLNEQGLISTTAEGGAGGADSANLIYSTTARTNVAYRVIGFVRSTQSTAGSWASTPTLVQGSGGTPVDRIITVGTAVASTSGTAIDFVNIPAWAKRVQVFFNGVSTNGSSPLQIQIGAGSVTTSGYASTAQVGGGTGLGTSFTSGFGLTQASSGNVRYGMSEMVNIGSNVWVSSHVIAITNVGTSWSGGGGVTLAGSLDRVRVTTVSGTDTFNAGSINILYE